jgi:hypothetical protein
MIKSNENNLSSTTNSNSYLDTEHDMHDLRYIDMLDENNNHNNNESTLKIQNCNNDQNNNLHLHRNNHLHPQVKFVTHFSNIKEDDNDDKN